MKEIIFIKEFIKESGKKIRAKTISLCQDREADEFIKNGYARINEVEELEKSVPLKKKKKNKWQQQENKTER